ncbi:MAG: hypothetical protein Q4G35_13295 [Propionibacteriaceae bacterium]|nr:hypothetical protein [Propionibacteriaceae bacterium]
MRPNQDSVIPADLAPCADICRKNPVVENADAEKSGVTAAPRFEEFNDASIQEDNLGRGFWAAEPYVGTKETWTYPELRLVLERYLIDRDGKRREFWNWTHCLTPDQVTEELEAAGFVVDSLFGDVAGARFDEEAPSFAVLARVA